MYFWGHTRQMSQSKKRVAWPVLGCHRRLLLRAGLVTPSARLSRTAGRGVSAPTGRFYGPRPHQVVEEYITRRRHRRSTVRSAPADVTAGKPGRATATSRATTATARSGRLFHGSVSSVLRSDHSTPPTGRQFARGAEVTARARRRRPGRGGPLRRHRLHGRGPPARAVRGSRLADSAPGRVQSAIFRTAKPPRIPTRTCVNCWIGSLRNATIRP